MTFKQFASSMVGGRAFQPMFNADGGSGGASGSDDPGSTGGADGGGSGDGSNPGEGAAAGAGTTTDDPGKVVFSEEQQRFIDSLINKTIKTERTKAEAERKRLEDLAKLDEAGRLKAELQDRDDKLSELQKERIDNQIERAARAAGVPEKKIARFIKLVDRAEVQTDDGSIDENQLTQAVAATLADMPEFKAAEHVRGPGGEGFEGGQPSKAKYTLAQIHAMDPKEVAADYEEVMKSLQVHQKK